MYVNKVKAQQHASYLLDVTYVPYEGGHTWRQPCFLDQGILTHLFGHGQSQEPGKNKMREQSQNSTDHHLGCSTCNGEVYSSE